MCCILYVPANVETPSIDRLYDVYVSNHDGCGFCDSDGNHCHTLSFNRFARAIKKRSIHADLIIHFRFATHGSVKTGNCHPFYDKDNDVWFAHNGVLPIDSVNDKTDSEIFFRTEFIPCVNRFGYDSKEVWQKADEARCSSRFIFMKGGNVKVLGEWHELDGVLYSNMRWQNWIKFTA